MWGVKKNNIRYIIRSILHQCHIASYSCAREMYAGDLSFGCQSVKGPIEQKKTGACSSETAANFPLAATPRNERAWTEQTGRKGTLERCCMREEGIYATLNHLRSRSRKPALSARSSSAQAYAGIKTRQASRQARLPARSSWLEGPLKGVQEDINAFALTAHKNCLGVLKFLQRSYVPLPSKAIVMS